MAVAVASAMASPEGYGQASETLTREKRMAMGEQWIEESPVSTFSLHDVRTGLPLRASATSTLVARLDLNHSGTMTEMADGQSSMGGVYMGECHTSVC